MVNEGSWLRTPGLASYFSLGRKFKFRREKGFNIGEAMEGGREN
jgi:hypothetical protein